MSLVSDLLGKIEKTCTWIGNRSRGGADVLRAHKLSDLLKAHRLTRDIHDGDAVLDVGCGNGRMLASLSMFRRIRCVGVDMAVPLAYPGIEARVFDGRRLPFEDASFDVAMLCFVLHHVTPADARALLAEVVRVTRRRLFLLEDSLPAFGFLDRLRNRCHRIDAGLRYRQSSTWYRPPRDESMFLTYDGWRRFLQGVPGVTAVEVESLAALGHSHHALLSVELASG